MKVDFHVHSTASDGTLAPSELVERASGFAALALTDHDNFDGIAEARSAALENELAFVPGIELSIEPGRGYDKFHLLALGVDVDSPALKSFLRKILRGRNDRNAQITENFRKLGIAMDDIDSYSHGEVLARPHYARWLVEHGIVSDIQEAFGKYLLPESPAETRCYEERYHPTQAETFAVVHGAGGLCIMAHPKYWRVGWKFSGVDYDCAESELATLKEAGLDGVEAFYQANSIEENLAFCRIADRLALVKSAGSDFHGANKARIPLGMTVEESFIGPLLERLGVKVH